MVGVSIFAGGQGPERFRDMGVKAAAAEAAGADAIWTGELYHRSATIPMAVMAQATSTAIIGCNIAYGVGRTPLVWAAEARDLDELSGGRLVLGLGNGTTGMMENWHGVDGSAPAVRMQELVEVLRKLWRLDLGPVHHEGRFYRVKLQTTTDVPPPLRDRLPIWTAGVNPAMIRVAGRVADGLVGHPMFTRKYVDEVVRPELEIGAKSTGRNTSDITLMGIRMCAVDGDPEQDRRRVAYAIAQYAASKVYDRLFALHGWSEQQLVIKEAARRRDVEAMSAAVPEELVDELGLVCTSAEFGGRVKAQEKDFDHFNVVAAPWGLDPEQAGLATDAIIAGLRPQNSASN